MKNKKATFIGQINHLFNKNGIDHKIISVSINPVESYETYDDFTGEFYVGEINELYVALVKSSSTYESRKKTRWMKDFENLTIRWNKKYGIDIDVAFI